MSNTQCVLELCPSHCCYGTACGSFITCNSPLVIIVASIVILAIPAIVLIVYKARHYVLTESVEEINKIRQDPEVKMRPVESNVLNMEAKKHKPVSVFPMLSETCTTIVSHNMNAQVNLQFPPPQMELGESRDDSKSNSVSDFAVDL